MKKSEKIIELDLFSDQDDFSVTPTDNGIMSLKNRPMIKSKKRVQSHGEVFTPDWMIEFMLNQPEIKAKAQDIMATFLEPSAGEGAFLVAILHRKLAAVNASYTGKSWHANALWALSSIYGIELLYDNLRTARLRMLEEFARNYKKVTNSDLSTNTKLFRSARTIIRVNIVQGNSLTGTNADGQPIVFSHWYKVKGSRRKVKRVPFTYSSVSGDRPRLHGGRETCLLPEFVDVTAISYAITDIEDVEREEREK